LNASSEFTKVSRADLINSLQHLAALLPAKLHGEGEGEIEKRYAGNAFYSARARALRGSGKYSIR